MTEPDNEITLVDVALAFAENIKLLVFTPIAAGLAAFSITFLVPPTYTATTKILPPAQQQSSSAQLSAQLGALVSSAGGVLGMKNPADQYVALLTSRSVLDSLVERFKLRELYDEGYAEDARKKLQERTRVVGAAKDGLITIEVEDRDPQRAADIANAFVDALRSLMNHLAVTEASQRRLFFETELKEAKDQLTAAELRLGATGMSEATLKTMPQSAVEALARLRAQITAQEIRIAAMRTAMTDENPGLRMALQELAALRGQLSRMQETNIAKTGDGSYVDRYRHFKYREALFEMIAKQYELARLDEAREANVIQVVDHARAPERKSGPKRALIAVVTMLAVLLALVVYVLLRRSLKAVAADERLASKMARIRLMLGMRGSEGH